MDKTNNLKIANTNTTPLPKSTEMVQKEKTSILTKILRLLKGVKNIPSKLGAKKTIAPAPINQKTLVSQLKSTKNKQKNKSKSTKRKLKRKTQKKLKMKNKKNPAKKIKKSSKKIKIKTKVSRIKKPIKTTPQLITPAETQPYSSTESFTELEEEALKAKKESELKEEAKNVVKEKEMIKELGEKIAQNVKETDFDRVLKSVQKYGKVEAEKLRKELNIPQKQFEMCYSILQKNEEIKLEYPLVGRMKLVAVNKKKNEE